MQINSGSNISPQVEVKKPDESETQYTRRDLFRAAAAGALVGYTPNVDRTVDFCKDKIEGLFKKGSFPVLSVPSTLTVNDMRKTLEWLKQPNAVISLFERLRLKKPKENPISPKHNISLGLEDIKELFEGSSNSSLLALWTLIRLRAQHNKENERPHSTSVFGDPSRNVLTGVLSYLRPDCSLIEIRDVVHGKIGSELAMEWLNEAKQK